MTTTTLLYLGCCQCDPKENTFVSDATENNFPL